MRWGHFTRVVVVSNLLVATFVACDSISRDAPARYYIAPDAGDDDGGGVPPEVLADASVNPSHAADGGADGSPAVDAGPGPSILGLSGWWRSYTAVPWAGTASAGGSGGQNLSQVTNPPTVGAPLNGFNTAQFNGTSNHLAGPAVSVLHTPTNLSGWALVNIDAIATDSATWSANDAIVATTGTGVFGVFLRDNGAGTVLVGAAAYGPPDWVVTTPIAKKAWQLVQWRADGATLGIRVNSGAWQTAPAGTIAAGLTAPLDVGRNPGQAAWLNGRIAELGMAAAHLGDPDFESVKSYINARYALNL
jgi:hypothetical protein